MTVVVCSLTTVEKDVKTKTDKNVNQRKSTTTFSLQVNEEILLIKLKLQKIIVVSQLISVLLKYFMLQSS
jgi:hypothetical protein